MTKQKEIREGIDMKAPIPQALNRVFLDFLADYDGYKVGALSECLDFYIARAITNAMYTFHSQGVVIKVNRELPKYYCGYVDYERDNKGELDISKPIFHNIYRKLNENQKKVLDEAGYVAVEPLIKEE